MVIQLSNSPIKYNEYVVQREFVEHSFVFSTERKCVSLLGEVKHFYVTDDDNRVELINLNYTKELLATNQTKVYADTGDYVQYEEIEKVFKDSEGNDVIAKEKVIKQEERGIIGEYDFFEKLRNTSIKINDLLTMVVQRADVLNMI